MWGVGHLTLCIREGVVHMGCETFNPFHIREGVIHVRHCVSCSVI